MTTDRGHVTRVTIPLRHRDMDTLGHLNQSMYHVFLEEARAKVLLDLLGEGEIRYVLARVELDHRHEVRMSDVAVHAEAWVSHVGRSSVRLGTRVVVGDDDLVAAEGSTVMVGWDRERRGSRPLDPDERDLLLAAQGVAS